MNEWIIVYRCAVHTQTLPLLCTLAKLQTVSISFIMSVSQSVCLSVHPSVHQCLSVCWDCMHGTTWVPLDQYSLNLIFQYFLKICEENSSIMNIWQEQKVLHVKTYVHLWYNLNELFLRKEIFQTKVAEKNKNTLDMQ